MLFVAIKRQASINLSSILVLPFVRSKPQKNLENLAYAGEIEGIFITVMPLNSFNSFQLIYLSCTHICYLSLLKMICRVTDCLNSLPICPK